MDITLEKLNEALPDVAEEDVQKYYESFLLVCETFDINTPKRMAAFLAQVGHESQNFTRTTENLNYSAKRLKEVFPKYFRTVSTESYARNPEKIANRVYSNRMGNGTEASGDGWKYRGRGLIQLTGKENYQNFAHDMEMTVDEAIEYIETPEGALMSAGWFWDKKNLNVLADQGKIKTISIRVNGGEHGLPDRIKKYKEALEVLDA
mgnify:CR=1 FL=1